jgi:hypothetical protein
MSQLPTDARHTVFDGSAASAGQVVDPPHVSSASQLPAETRQTVAEAAAT